MIDGQRVPSISGATFETRSPGRIEDANPEA
jgi:hypothetical protein